LTDLADNRKLVLVVENDPAANGHVMDVLCEAGYRVLETASQAVALRAARRHQPAAILLDLALSDGSGLDLLARLKSEKDTANLPIVVVSEPNEALRQPTTLQADARLSRQFSQQSLLKVIGSFVDDGYVPLRTSEREPRITMATSRRAVS
jgi:DNA-binding response OmpR family regulator